MSTFTTPQKPFPIFVPDGHRGERSNPPPSPSHHPYAIKTTSTGILTRSNSTGFSAPTRHNYVPTSPSPSAKHRYSKSDYTTDRTADRAILHPSPRPLPTPPSLGSPTKAGFELRGGYTSSEDLRNISSWRNHRSEARALPTPPPSSPVKVDDLPSNPKLWTTTQLASYLMTALRVRTADSRTPPIPLAVAKDIAAFVKDARLNGRSFLRLNEQDLEGMGVNGLWCEALLNASRSLRQNVVKGRIWGKDMDNQDADVFASPYKYRMYNSSASSLDDIPGSLETTPSNKNRSQGSRVRGLVANLERTSSCGSGGLGSGFSNHASATSEGDHFALAAAWADDEGASASGSEASEAEGLPIGTITKRPLVQEPITPPVEFLQEIPTEVEIADTTTEPSVQDLLASNPPLSHSWGARAWEEIDLNAGETVKRIGVENDLEEAPILKPTLTGTTFGRGSARGSRRTGGAAVNNKMAIKDIFSRPLPTPPSQTGSPRSGSPERVITLPTRNLCVRLDQCTQTEEDQALSVATSEGGQQTDEWTSPEAEELKAALSLIEALRARLMEVEDNLKALEAQKAERLAIERSDQNTQTECEVSVEPEILAKSDQPTEPPAAMQSAEEPLDGASALDLEYAGLAVRRDWSEFIKPSGDWDPLENGVTSYVFMVGVGVCAVVLSTFLKRLATKRA